MRARETSLALVGVIVALVMGVAALVPVVTANAGQNLMSEERGEEPHVTPYAYNLLRVRWL